MIKSPLRYPGGKSRAVKIISPIIPDFDEFREPFLGGGSVFVFLKQKCPKKTFWINDLYPNLYYFWKQTQQNLDKLSGFSKTAYEKRFTQSSIERVKFLSSILTATKITNYDYQKVIEEKGDNVFIFLDPPYYSAAKSALYGKNGNLHKTFDHERFANALKNTKHKWLITYDDSEYIRGLFSFANITEWNLTYGMRNVNKNGNQNGKELFISNYHLS